MLSGCVAGGGYGGVLATTQDYLVTVPTVSVTGADYTREITMPPL